MLLDLGQLTLPIVVVVVFFLISAIKVVREYERLVVFRLGRLNGKKVPVSVRDPFIDRFVRVSLRIITLDVPTQEVLPGIMLPPLLMRWFTTGWWNPTGPVVTWRISFATAQLAQTTLRSVAGQAELDELLAERDKLNQQIQDP